MATVGIFILIVLVGIGISYWSYQNNQKRAKALQQFALGKGWAYTPRDDRQWTRWQQAPFNEGFDRRATNVLTGHQSGHDLVAFDYTYKTQTSNSKGGTNTQTHRYHVCALAMPTWLPTLQVGPESVFTRMGNAMGMNDIELESEDFNRRFRVHANDQKFAYDVLSPRTIQKLLAMPAYHWRIDGQTIVSWALGRTEIPDLLSRLNALTAVLDGIPDFVWHQNGVPEQSTILPPTPITPQAPAPSITPLIPPTGGTS